MAPRVSKPKDSACEPKTEKAKVEKTSKPSKAKVVKPKATAKDKGDGGKGKEKEKEKEKEKAEIVKEKVKAVVGEEAVRMMLGYLKAQNRPYSATEVSANLKGKVTKTVADKLLKELGEAKDVGMNSTNADKKGSQFVFWTLQDPADAASPEDLAAMDSTISTLKASNPTLKSALKSATAKLATLKSAPTKTELETTIYNLTSENKVKKEKLDAFLNGRVSQVSKEDVGKVEKEYKYWAVKKRERKRAYEGLEDLLMGGMTREEIREKCGVESDEE